MSQDIQVIECKKIKAAKSGKKGLTSATLDQLYDSISKEGLLHPIVVRPHRESAGYYEIVAGEHRFYVISKMIKEESIACRVFTDMSDEEAELAQLSENACRTNAKPTDRLLILRKWQEVYQKNYPQLVGKKASGTSRWADSTRAEAKQKAIDEEKAQEAAEIAEESNCHSGNYSGGDDAEVATDAEPAPAAEKPETFRERVQKATGAKARTLDRDLKIAKGLNDEQIWALDLVQCTKMGMLKIIDATPDLGKRGEIVALVASGMEVEDAIKDVVGVTVTKDEAGRVKEVGESAKPMPAIEPELSDEEWFERHCTVVAPSIANPDQYKSDAILYRRISNARTKFRKEVKKILEGYREDRKGKKVGWFFLSLNRVLSVSHPNDWKLCETCGGSGLGRAEAEDDACEKCHGAGYNVTTEKYA